MLPPRVSFEPSPVDAKAAALGGGGGSADELQPPREGGGGCVRAADYRRKCEPLRGGEGEEGISTDRGPHRDLGRWSAGDEALIVTDPAPGELRGLHVHT